MIMGGMAMSIDDRGEEEVDILEVFVIYLLLSTLVVGTVRL
jgi:hypothetical protein